MDSRKSTKSKAAIKHLAKLARESTTIATEHTPEAPSPLIVAENAAKVAEKEMSEAVATGKEKGILAAARKVAELKAAAEAAKKAAVEDAAKKREEKAAARKAAVEAVAAAEKAMSEAITGGKAKVIVETARAVSEAKAVLEAMGPATGGGERGPRPTHPKLFGKYTVNGITRWARRNGWTREELNALVKAEGYTGPSSTVSSSWSEGGLPEKYPSMAVVSESEAVELKEKATAALAVS